MRFTASNPSVWVSQPHRLSVAKILWLSKCGANKTFVCFINFSLFYSTDPVYICGSVTSFLLSRTFAIVLSGTLSVWPIETLKASHGKIYFDFCFPFRKGDPMFWCDVTRILSVLNFWLTWGAVRLSRNFIPGLFCPSLSFFLIERYVYARWEEEKQIIARLHILLILKSLLIIWTARFCGVSSRPPADRLPRESEPGQNARENSLQTINSFHVERRAPSAPKTFFSVEFLTTTRFDYLLFFKRKTKCFF